MATNNAPDMAGASTHQRFVLHPAAFAASDDDRPSPLRKRRGPPGSRGLGSPTAAETVKTRAFTAWYRLFTDAVAAYAPVADLVSAEATCRRVRSFLLERNVWLDRLEQWSVVRRRVAVGLAGTAMRPEVDDAQPDGSVEDDRADDAPRSIFTGIAESVRLDALRRGKPPPRRTHFDGAMSPLQWKSLVLRRTAEDLMVTTGGERPQRSTADDALRAQPFPAGLLLPPSSAPEQVGRIAQVVLRVSKQWLASRSPSRLAINGDPPSAVRLGRGGIQILGPDDAVRSVAVYLWPHENDVGVIVHADMPVLSSVSFLHGGELETRAGTAPAASYSNPPGPPNADRVTSLPVRARNRDGTFTPTAYGARFALTSLCDCSEMRRWSGRLIPFATFEPTEEDAVVLVELTYFPPLSRPVFVSEVYDSDMYDSGSFETRSSSASEEADRTAGPPRAGSEDGEGGRGMRRVLPRRNGRPTAHFSAHMPWWQLTIGDRRFPEPTFVDRLVCPAITLGEVLADPVTTEAMKAGIFDEVAEAARAEPTTRERALLQRALLPHAIKALRSPRHLTRRMAQSCLWNLTDATYNMVTLEEIGDVITAVCDHIFNDISDAISPEFTIGVCYAWWSPAIGCLWNLFADKDAAAVLLHHPSGLFDRLVNFATESVENLRRDVGNGQSHTDTARLRYDLLMAVCQLLSSVVVWWADAFAGVADIQRLHRADTVLTTVATELLRTYEHHVVSIVMGPRDGADFGVRLVFAKRGTGCAAWGSFTLTRLFLDEIDEDEGLP